MPQVLSHEVDAYDYGTVSYLPNPQHRDGNPNKSQWSINVDIEIYVFQYMAYSNWLLKNNGWGLYINDGMLDYLGNIQSRSTAVFIAKFVVDPNHNAWHGYPADYQRKVQDVPDKAILQMWMEKKHLSKAKVRKIMMGQPCKI